MRSVTQHDIQHDGDSQHDTEPFEYVRPIRPLYFPVAAEVPETQRHLELRTALYQLLRRALSRT